MQFPSNNREGGNACNSLQEASITLIPRLTKKPKAKQTRSKYPARTLIQNSKPKAAALLEPTNKWDFLGKCKDDGSNEN